MIFLLITLSGTLRAQSWWLADTTLRNWVDLTVYQPFSSSVQLSGVFRVYESPHPSYGTSFMGLFRGSLDLSGPSGRLILGDVEEPWGMGLLFYPVYEPETQREQFLRGGLWMAPGDHFLVAVGQPLVWTYFHPEGQPDFRMGLLGVRGGHGGAALALLRDPAIKRERRSVSGYTVLSLGPVRAEGEGLWSVGFDPLLAQDTMGFGLYGRMEMARGSHTVRIEGKWYEGLYSLLALPPPVNRLGVLPSGGRSEAGVSFSLEGRWKGLVFSLEGAAGWDPWKPDSLNFREVSVSALGRAGGLRWRMDGIGYRWGDALGVIGKDHRSEVRLQGEAEYGVVILSVTPRWVEEGHSWQETTVSLSVAPRPWKVEGGMIASDSLGGWLALSYLPPYPWSFTVRAGKIRGDLVCAGGVCRYEPPFRGLDLTLEMQF